MRSLCIGALCVMMFLFVGCVEDLGLNNTPANSGGVQVTDPTAPNYGDPTSWPEGNPFEIGDNLYTRGMCVDPLTGNMFFVGKTDIPNDSFWTVAMDANGVLLFDPILIDTPDMYDDAMAVSYCESSYQTVRANDDHGTGGADQVFLEGWSLNGDMLFSHELLSQLGVIHCYAVNFHNEKVYVAGLMPGFGYLAYYNTTDGSWSSLRQLNGWPMEILIGPDGEIIVTGTTDLGMVPGKSLNGPNDFFIAAYTADLTSELWAGQPSWPLRQRDGFGALWNDDGVYVVVVGGASGDPINSIPYTALAVAYDAVTGDSLWAVNDDFDPIVDIAAGQDAGIFAVTASNPILEGEIVSVSENGYSEVLHDYVWRLGIFGANLYYISAFSANVQMHGLVNGIY